MKIQKATHEGSLPIGENNLNCAVLENGKRVIKASSIFKAFGRTKRGAQKDGSRAENMPAFLNPKNLQLFVDEELRTLLVPQDYIEKNGAQSKGYDAIILPKMCKVYLDARQAGAIKASQLPQVRASEILLLGLAGVGIIALVDEATGYQKERAKDALQKFLDSFFQKEKGKWVKTFPDEFFETIYKMKGWDWEAATKGQKPGVIGTYINDYVWSRLAPSVLEELKINNPVTEKGYRKYKHPQLINPDFGHPILKQHLQSLITLGKASGYNWTGFQRLVNRAFPVFGKTKEIDFNDGY